MRKYCQTVEQRKEIILTINNTFEILPTLKTDIINSMESNINDLEDAVIDEICSTNCISYLVTNNIKAFKNSRNVILTPEEAVKLIEIDM